MRVMLVLVAVAMLGLSGFAAWFFFGGPEDDPARKRFVAHMARIGAVQPRAGAGDIEAQYELGRLYHDGRFVPADVAEAYRWYRKAAEKGHVGAQYAIGAMFAKGEAVKQSYTRAAEWYELAANMGRHPGAQFALGQLYYYGHGLARDYAEAFSWYKKAARWGQPVAQHLLGAMLQDGWAGPPDPVQAYKWFTLAIRQRRRVMAHDPNMDPRASRDELVRGMNRNQIERAEKAVKDWRPGE